MIRIIDDVLADPEAYRAEALAQDFRDVTIGPDTFRGIAACPSKNLASAAGIELGAEPVLTFFRKSPAGQREPNFIHSDADMGRFTGIYYMNPKPAPLDGTLFWERAGARSGPWTGEVAESARTQDGWMRWQWTPAAFNRLLLFSSDLFHSRSLLDNYGHGDEARLIQVVFLR